MYTVFRILTSPLAIHVCVRKCEYTRAHTPALSLSHTHTHAPPLAHTYTHTRTHKIYKLVGRHFSSCVLYVYLFASEIYKFAKEPLIIGLFAENDLLMTYTDKASYDFTCCMYTLLSAFTSPPASSITLSSSLFPLSAATCTGVDWSCGNFYMHTYRIKSVGKCHGLTAHNKQLLEMRIDPA